MDDAEQNSGGSGRNLSNVIKISEAEIGTSIRVINKVSIVKITFLIGALLLSEILAAADNVPAEPPAGGSVPTDDAAVGAPLTRESKIPPSAVKITPQMDVYPPRSLSDEYEAPVPLPYPINTAGAEDSPFILPDGKTLYFWFTPETNVPAQRQLFDGVTGIYVSKKMKGLWSRPERVLLQDPGKLALDGAQFIQGNTMWFCSARTGYTGLHWFTAELKGGKWANWKKADFNPDYQVGEFHITRDGKELYFHSSRPGGRGKYDIWVSRKTDGKWRKPENVEVVNSPHVDGWPMITPDDRELWFSRQIGAPDLYRSKRVDGKWQKPEHMFSQFAAESTVDHAGNVYFTHHFYKNDVMLEADIYVAYRKVAEEKLVPAK